MPTRARLPSITPSLTVQLIPSDTPTVTPSVTLTATATATLTPTLTPTITATNFVASETPPPVVLLGAVTEATATLQIQQRPTRPFATPLPEAFVFGRSAGGQNLTAYRYGTGQQVIILVGGIHAGYEANTSALMNELRNHFNNNPTQIAANVTLLIIPEFNIDGVQYGRALRGRFNANGVDLNRNWGCGWEPTAYFQENNVFPGSAPFSEPETQSLGSLIQRVQPAAVLFYHAAADGVFAGSCDGGRSPSLELAQVYGDAAGYRSGATFSAYPVSGTAPEWVDSQGFPAVDVELRTSTETEFSRNLQGVLAVQQWVAGR